MASLFGYVSEETPTHEVIRKCKEYEIRKYSACVAIETKYEADHVMGSRGGTFMKLARFIGVTSKPQNVREESISMTAPVAMSPDTTSTGSYAMRFFLPKKKYSEVSKVPLPKDKDVSVVQVPQRVYAVRTFSGSFSKSNIDANERALRGALSKSKDVKVPSASKVSVFGYNPPWTLPIFRTNEVLLPVDLA
eukprot:g1143.t1